MRVAARTAERLSAGQLDGADEGARARTTWPGWPRRSTRWPTSLQRQIRRLEELSRVQRRFVSDVSHELRTPLTTVRMAADLLHEAREDFDPAVAPQSAELLQTQLDRFEALLADLLEISRFDAGRRGARRRADRPARRRRAGSSRRLRAAGRAQGLELLIAGTPDEPCIAEVDPRRIERILRNLRRQRHRARRGPAGRGRGWPPTTRRSRSPCATTASGCGRGRSSLVFNRFWRADPARARTTGGTGLGLSIALEDARLHGGWLQAWGAARATARSFRLTLPRTGGSRPRPSSPLPLEPADAVERRVPVAVGVPIRRPGASPPTRAEPGSAPGTSPAPCPPKECPRGAARCAGGPRGRLPGGCAALVAGARRSPPRRRSSRATRCAGGQDDQLIRVMRPAAERGDDATGRSCAGFLEASASFDGDYAGRAAVPRPRGARGAGTRPAAWWSTTAPWPSRADPAANTVVVGHPRSRRITDRGRVRGVAGPGATLSDDFALPRVDGEWRIAAAPDGLRPRRRRREPCAYRSYNLYFLDPTQRPARARPGVRPGQQSGIATSLVRSVLLGPTPWLAPAVSTAFRRARR